MRAQCHAAHHSSFKQRKKRAGSITKAGRGIVKPMRLDVEDDHDESKKQRACQQRHGNWSPNRTATDARYSEFMVRGSAYQMMRAVLFSVIFFVAPVTHAEFTSGKRLAQGCGTRDMAGEFFLWRISRGFWT